MRALLPATLLLITAACTDVDPTGLPSIDGYESWPSRVATNEIPGHGPSYRITYANDLARSYRGGRYPLGAVLVKKIYHLDGAGGPGELDYVAIMRKVGQEPYVPADQLPDVPIDAGWVFTQLRDGSERHLELCWANCHRQAPFDSAWFDYGE